VCGTETDLVEHHDHFSDLCLGLLRGSDGFRRYQEQARAFFAADPDHWLAAPGRPERPPWWGEDHHHSWETFPRTLICERCNGIDAEIKQAIGELPRWVSFAPDELQVWGRSEDLVILADEIWPARRAIYQPWLCRLLELGVTREALDAAWHDRSPQDYGARGNRRVMLQHLAAAPDEMRALCGQPGNEAALADWIRRLDWPPRPAHNFIFWYHAGHGDPQCRHNQFGIGQQAFVAWWAALVAGDEAGAGRILEHGIERRRRKLARDDAMLEEIGDG
jgi:hypothetical protein